LQDQDQGLSFCETLLITICGINAGASAGAGLEAEAGAPDAGGCSRAN